MIRVACEDDVQDIFNLFRKTYKSHSMIEKGESEYINMIENGKYVGFVFVEDGTILGHAGVTMGEDFTLINCLVTDKNARGQGIGRKLFEAREEFCDNSSKDFIVGYSMMQHPFSQLLYSDAFKPIGMVIDYSDIYSKNEGNLNKGTSNAEMVLCKRTKPFEVLDVEMPQITPSNELFKKIIKTLDVKPTFTSNYTIPHDKIFLGFTPDIESGLFTLEVTKPKPQTNFDLMITTNLERENFKNEIKKQY